MDRLHTELQRLYHAPAADAGNPLLAPDGRTRAVVLELAQPPGWAALAAVWHGVQDELELPAPAIAVSGTDAYQLWFALAEAVTLPDAQAFLDTVVRRWLPQVPATRLRRWPTLADGGIHHTPAVPCRHGATGHWSAFVAPGLASLFEDDPWLDTPPSADAQADLLSRLRPIAPAAFRSLCQRPATAERPLEAATDPAAANDPVTPATAGHSVAPGAPGPRAFLLALMNDPTAPLPLRLDAAKALLPYC
uniref:hypothetical protein n=1 Tax=Macromonas nakdongensis TaxID=1843082 RepID=UPI000C323FE5